jgi:protein-disulfide isomerase
MIAAMRNLLTLAAVVTLLACSTGAQQPAAGQAGGDAAARVGDKTITVKELDDRWRQNDPAGSAQATQALYDGRRAALDDLIATMLIEEAAKAKGQTAAQFTDAEIAKRLKPVTDTEIAVFYGENRAQMQGRSLEQMSDLIRQFLNDRQKQTARAAMIAELRKAGPPVRVMFEPPRQQIAIAADDPSLGPANAPVTIVEFSDFQCPFCQRVVPTIKQIKAKYGDRVRIVWKDFPLTQIHPQAFDAAQAGNCAREQGKFWEYHDQLFANQAALQPEFLKKYATDAGMNGATFSACLDSGKFQPKVQAALEAGGKLGIGSTPTSYINGRAVTGAQPIEVFEAVIDEELQKQAGR